MNHVFRLAAIFMFLLISFHVFETHGMCDIEEQVLTELNHTLESPESDLQHDFHKYSINHLGLAFALFYSPVLPMIFSENILASFSPFTVNHENKVIIENFRPPIS